MLEIRGDGSFRAVIAERNEIDGRCHIRLARTTWGGKDALDPKWWSLVIGRHDQRVATVRNGSCGDKVLTTDVPRIRLALEGPPHRAGELRCRARGARTASTNRGRSGVAARAPSVPIWAPRASTTRVTSGRTRRSPRTHGIGSTRYAQRILGNTAPVPVDLVTASSSGLDPHISPAAARYQVSRIARLRGQSTDAIQELVGDYTEGRTFGILGEPRVSVLQLNRALDAKFGAPRP